LQLDDIISYCRCVLNCSFRNSRFKFVRRQINIVVCALVNVSVSLAIFHIFIDTIRKKDKH